ncbi:MAG: TetR/AcrR family transcriptional regulator [Bacteroidota bacterium]
MATARTPSFTTRIKQIQPLPYMNVEKKSKRRAGRPKKNKDLNPDTILRTALKNFAQQGYGGITINKIATQTGVADSLLYYHFGNKEELWKRAMSLVGMEIHKELHDLFHLIDDLDGLEKLRLYNKKIVHVSAKYPEFQQVVVQEVFSDNPRSAWLIDSLLKPIFQPMQTILLEERSKGTIKKIPLANLFSFIIGSITTLFTRSFQMKKMHGIDSLDDTQIDLHVTVINDLIFNGLLDQ